VLESAVVHVEASQYVVAAAVISFLPAAHVIDEQSALFVQHLTVLLCTITAVLFLKGSWNAAGPHLRSVCEEHAVRVGLVSQHVLTSAAVPHVAPWQYVVVLAAICFMAVGHVSVVHRAAVPQHWETVVPTAPFLDVSLYLPTPQDTPDHSHLVRSFSQQVVCSWEVQAAAPQYVVAAAAMAFLPVAHVTDEHFALFEQHRAAVSPVTPYLAGSLNSPAAHVTLAARHLPATFSQHVASSALVHTDFAQYVVACAVFFFKPAEHVSVEHNAFPVQQLYLPAEAPILPVSLNLQDGHLTVTPLHLVSSSSQQVLWSAVAHTAPAQYVVA
jgi:hypothetical protein